MSAPLRRRVNGNDIAAGLLCLAIAAVVLFEVHDLRFGTLRRMGPGFMPNVLGWMLAGFGVVLLALGLRPGAHPRMETWVARPMVAIGASVLVFAFAIGSLGLAITVFASIVVASLATPELRWYETLGMALFLGIGSHLLFISALGMTMPRWPVFF